MFGPRDVFVPFLFLLTPFVDHAEAIVLSNEVTPVHECRGNPFQNRYY